MPIKLITAMIIFSSMTINIATAKLPRGYQDQTAAKKQNILFSNISHTPLLLEEILSKKNPGVFESLNLFSTTQLAKSFTHDQDEFESPRKKLIHTYGAAAKIKINITQPSPYTGLLKTGGLGIIRFSLAKLATSESSYSPGIAIKFLVDGQKSQNTFAMFSLDGQGNNYNFFENNFETKISGPESTVLKFLGTRFKKTMVELGSEHRDPTLQSSRQISEVKSNGASVASPRAPFSLVFVPTKVAQMRKSFGNVLVRLGKKQFSEGVVIYKIYTRELERSQMKLLGNIELDSRVIASEYGDRELFFQHNID